MYSELSIPEDRNWTLDELSHVKSTMLVPSIVYLCMLMVIGVAGNVLVISVYYFRFNRSTHRCFILVLASSDLFACSVGVPFAIAESFHAYTYTEHVSCRILRFVLYYTTICSSLTLVLIALERFRKICRPLKRQMSISMAKKALILVNAGISFVSASPALIMFGRNTIQTGVSNKTGTKCFISDTFVDTKWPTVFNIYLLCLAIASTVIMSVCYISVARQVSNVGKENIMKRQSLQNDASKICKSTASDMDGDSEILSGCISQNEDEINSQYLEVTRDSSISTSNGMYNRVSAAESSDAGNCNGTKTKHRLTANPSQWAIKVMRRISSRSAEKTLRITRMLVVVTVVFVLSYLPHLSLMLWDMFTETYETLPKDNLYQIIFYSFFLNNLINPFIYASMDLKFRGECKKLFCCVKKQ